MKEFIISYEVNKLKNNTSYELIKQLREENNFLKNQVNNNQKILIKDILENNSRQTQSIETVCKKVNEWQCVKVKTKIYRTYIMPVVLYDLDCSTWKQTSLQMLEVFQNHIMRFMTSHTMLDKVKITTPRQHTNLRPLASFLKEKKLKLFGHIKCSSKGLAKVCLEGKVLGKRSKGRPRQLVQ